MNNPDTYELLVEHGVPPVWAERLSREPVDATDSAVFTGDLFDYIHAFATWEDTEEGFDFWVAVAYAVHDHGVAGLDRFPTPWAE